MAAISLRLAHVWQYLAGRQRPPQAAAIYFPGSVVSTIAMIAFFSDSANLGQASTMRARSCLISL